MNSAMIHNTKKKNTLRRKLKKSPKSVNLREKFKHLRATIKKMLRESWTNYVNSICDDHGNNPKRFWSLFKLKSKSCNVPEKVSMRAEGNSRKYAETPADVATLSGAIQILLQIRLRPTTICFPIKRTLPC